MFIYVYVYRCICTYIYIASYSTPNKGFESLIAIIYDFLQHDPAPVFPHIHIPFMPFMVYKTPNISSRVEFLQEVTAARAGSTTK